MSTLWILHTLCQEYICAKNRRDLKGKAKMQLKDTKLRYNQFDDKQFLVTSSQPKANTSWIFHFYYDSEYTGAEKPTSGALCGDIFIWSVC